MFWWTKKQYKDKDKDKYRDKYNIEYRYIDIYIYIKSFPQKKINKKNILEFSTFSTHPNTTRRDDRR